MNRNRWIILLGIILLSAVGLPALHKSLEAQDKKAPPDKKPANGAADNLFAGKVLIIQKKNDTSPPVIQAQRMPEDFGGMVIENASVTDVAGIRCLTGHGIERANGEPAGPRISMPLDTIGTIFEFDSIEAYKEFEEQLLEKMQNDGIMGVPAPFGPQVPVDPPEA
jgi:hypothetical protein